MSDGRVRSRPDGRLTSLRSLHEPKTKRELRPIQKLASSQSYAERQSIRSYCRSQLVQSEAFPCCCSDELPAGLGGAERRIRPRSLMRWPDGGSLLATLVDVAQNRPLAGLGPGHTPLHHPYCWPLSSSTDLISVSGGIRANVPMSPRKDQPTPDLDTNTTGPEQGSRPATCGPLRTAAEGRRATQISIALSSQPIGGVGQKPQLRRWRPDWSWCCTPSTATNTLPDLASTAVTELRARSTVFCSAQCASRIQPRCWLRELIHPTCIRRITIERYAHTGTNTPAD